VEISLSLRDLPFNLGFQRCDRAAEGAPFLDRERRDATTQLGERTALAERASLDLA
jgi:hypothetical protein